MTPRARQILFAAVAVAGMVATACEPVPTAPGTERVVVFGDSIPAWALRDGPSGVDTDEVTLVNATLEACEGVASAPPARSRSGDIVPMTSACAAGWPSLYPRHLTIRPAVSVVMGGTHAMLDHKIDGTWRHPCHSPARTWYGDDLEARLRYVAERSDQVVLVLPAWPGTNSGWIMPADATKRADCVRSVMAAAARDAGVPTIDVGTYLCPTGATSCAPWRTTDGIHIDRGRAATVVRWLLDTARGV